MHVLSPESCVDLRYEIVFTNRRWLFLPVDFKKKLHFNADLFSPSVGIAEMAEQHNLDGIGTVFQHRKVLAKTQQINIIGLKAS